MISAVCEGHFPVLYQVSFNELSIIGRNKRPKTGRGLTRYDERRSGFLNAQVVEYSGN